MNKNLRHILLHARLPHHANMYYTQCNLRQRAILDRLRGFEEKGYKHTCNASNDWWVEKYLPTQLIKVSESTFRRDLLHLEKMGLIRRNIWNKPREAGGKVRIIYTAWGLQNYARYFLLRNTRYNNKDKPRKVFADFFDFEKEIQELNQEFVRKNSFLKSL